jgi:hypothetical protein
MRRYTELRPSAGTQIPAAMRRRVLARDHGCVGPRIGLDGPCLGAIELDHIRASHAMGKKSETAEHNLVSPSAADITWFALKTAAGFGRSSWHTSKRRRDECRTRVDAGRAQGMAA